MRKGAGAPAGCGQLCGARVFTFTGDVIQSLVLSMRTALVCCHYCEPTGWVRPLLDNNKGLHIYMYDCGVKSICKNARDHPRLHIENKRGDLRTCDNTFSYFDFCMQHYDSLPDFVYFVHGHDTAWHQPLPIGRIIALCQKDEITPYINLSMSIHDSTRAVLANWVTDLAKTQLHHLYAASKHSLLHCMPQTIFEISSAQARVSRARILATPHNVWRSLAAMAATCCAHSSMGYALEASFHRIMGEPWDRCSRIRSTESFEHDCALDVPLMLRRTRRTAT